MQVHDNVIIIEDALLKIKVVAYSLYKPIVEATPDAFIL
jgi:hypothetical protein